MKSGSPLVISDQRDPNGGENCRTSGDQRADEYVIEMIQIPVFFRTLDIARSL